MSLVRKSPFYFALEGVVASGKSTTLNWVEKLFMNDAHNLRVVREPVEEFDKWSSYKPLSECYRDPRKNAAVAQLHILKQSFNHYVPRLISARKEETCDVVLSERCIFSPLVFTEAYFREHIFSPFTRDYIRSEWEEYMTTHRSDAESRLITPDFIIQIGIDPNESVLRILKDGNRSNEECEFNASNGLSFSTSLAGAYESVYRDSSVNVPVEKIHVTPTCSEFAVAQKVYLLMKREICAEDKPVSHSQSIGTR